MSNQFLTWLLRIIVIVVALALIVFLAIRVPKLIFSSSVQAGEDTCGNDPDYHYKDPIQYPYGC